MQSQGIITAVRGQIAEVTFPSGQPARHEILTVTDCPEIVLEVISSATESSVFCLILNSGHSLARGMAVQSTGDTLKIPVGKEVLGRAFDIFGNPHDSQDPLPDGPLWPVFAARTRRLQDIVSPNKVVETGIFNLVRINNTRGAMIWKKLKASGWGYLDVPSELRSL